MFGAHIQLAYSRCCLIMTLYNCIKFVDVKYLNVCLRHPKVPTTPGCTWWNRPEDHSSVKLESTHPSRTSVKYDQGFWVSSQSCVSMLPHYTSELLLPRHQELWITWQRTWSWQTTTTLRHPKIHWVRTCIENSSWLSIATLRFFPMMCTSRHSVLVVRMITAEIHHLHIQL